MPRMVEYISIRGTKMHSYVYNKWMLTPFLAKNNIILFKKRKKDIRIFTKEEIINLCNNTNYCYLFKTMILVDHIAYLYEIFDIEEYMQFMYHHSEIRVELFSYLVKNYNTNKELLFQLRNESLYFLSFTKTFSTVILYKMLYNEKNYTSFLPTKCLIDYLLFEKKDPYYEEVLIDFLSNPSEIKRALKENNTSNIKDYMSFLKIITASLYFDQIYQSCRIHIYEHLIKIKTSQENKDLIITVSMIIEELLAEENLHLWDLAYVKNGSFCTVYKAGKYVFKFGDERVCNEICTSENLLYPLIRKWIKELGLFLEIAHLADCQNITWDDVYEIYKKEREQKRVWIDAKKDNLGRLLYDNGNYNHKLKKELIGFKEELISFKKKGELSIIDTDLLFEENNIPFKKLKEEHIILCHYQKMEKRYLEEKSLILTK